MHLLLRVATPALALLLSAAPAGTALEATLAPESYVAYTAADARGPFRGRAPVGDLELSFDPERLGSLRLRVAVEAGRFDSGNLIRDTNARRTVFDAGRYPDISFEATGLARPGAALPEGAQLEATLRGRLSMHGVTRQLRVPVTVTRKAGALRATGYFVVRLSDYGMTRPSFLWWTVNDEVAVDFDIRAAVSPAD